MHEEDALQITCMSYLRFKHPDLLAWHTPNGGSRNAIEGAKLKRMGVRPGVPDIIILNGKDIAFIELKSKKGILSDHQKTFIDSAEKLGHFTALVRSLDEFKTVLNMFLYNHNMTD